MSQPVELIVANAAHEIAERIQEIAPLKEALSNKLEELGGKKLEDGDFRHKMADGFAERLLCQIAHNASPSIVRKALAALGAPHEDDELWGRLESAREAQRAETNDDEQHPRAN